MKRRSSGLLASRRGMALIMVVMVLTSMLLLGTAFMANIRLDVRASVNYSRAGQGEIYALEGLHRAFTEILYDIWGVDEPKAFVCSPEWGQMTHGYSINGVNMFSAYSYEGNSATQVTYALSNWRRTHTNSTVPDLFAQNRYLRTNFRWVRQFDGSGNPLAVPVQAGGYYWDEFLPEYTDNSDLWQCGLHFNDADATGRDYEMDETENAAPGTSWDGDYFPVNSYGAHAPWDYIDSRIVPDAFFHVFRFDLVAGDNKVRCNGVPLDGAGDGDPLAIPLDLSHVDFAATHKGMVGLPSWPVDRFGGATNLNQVNNDYKWELFYNWKAYGSVPAWGVDAGTNRAESHHYKEAKWIYIYDILGERKLGRYAVTVEPDAASPNANHLYDGRYAIGADWTNLASTGPAYNTTKYLRAIDAGFLPHGDSGYGDDPDLRDANHANTIVVKDPKYAYANCGTDWAANTCTRVGVHIEQNGPVVARSELALLLRKDAFDDGTEEDKARDALIMTSLLTTAGYEYLMGPHWEQDRIIIDSSESGTINGASGYLNLTTSEGQDTRNSIAEILRSLKYYWGPDNRSNPNSNVDTDHYTALWWPTDSEDVPIAATALGASKAGQRLRSNMAITGVMSWLGGAQGNMHDYFHVRDFDDECNITCFFDGVNFQYRWQPSYSGNKGLFKDFQAVAELPAPHRIVQVGYCHPEHPTQAENRNTKDSGFPVASGEPGFDQAPMDGATNGYYFINIVQNCRYTSSDTRASVPDGVQNPRWRLYVGTNAVDTFVVGEQGDGIPDPHRGKVFAMYGNPDMDGDGQGDNFQADNSGGNDQSLREDIWSAEASSTEPDTPWLDSHPSIGLPVCYEPGPGMVHQYRWSPNTGWLAQTETYTGRGNGGNWDDCWNWGEKEVSHFASEIRDNVCNYITIYWHEDLNITGDEVYYVGAGTVMDYAKLPGDIVNLKTSPRAEQAYSSFDYMNNAHPNCWQKTYATPAWRHKFYFYRAEHNDQFKAWASGRPPNFFMHMWPSDIRDIRNLERGYSIMGQVQVGGMQTYQNWNVLFGQWTDFRRCPIPIPPSDNLDNYKSGAYSFLYDQDLYPVYVVQTDETAETHFVNPITSKGTDQAGALAITQPAYDTYNPYGWNTPVASQELACQWLYDPMLTSMSNLDEVAPIAEYFETGYLYEAATHLLANAVPNISNAWPYPVFDGLDNNNDGIIDIPTNTPLMAGKLHGHFISDRKSVGRININAITHPAAVWFMSIGGEYTCERNQLAIVGRKPLKGYTSIYQYVTRNSYGEGVWGNLVPYNKLVWYDNLWADVSTESKYGDLANFVDAAIGYSAQIAYTGPTPVHTIYVTAQSLKDNMDSTVEALSEIKIRATVERTWDGKLNIMEFTWIPEDMPTQ
ncbi:MAG: hypothetical protein JW909_08820 [Planctomycetes bacterium]|nr:hypothetical protein [Planctomycetota bacterium]